ncbi:MAG: hypothetical protein ABEJ81_08740 [Haloferacaceae archaeon]
MRPTPFGFESGLSVAVFLIGALLFVLGAVGITLDFASGIPLSGPGLLLDLVLELLGVLAGAGAFLSDRIGRPASPSTGSQPDGRRIHITQPLLETLLRLARRADPDSLSLPLAVTPAGQLGGAPTVSKATPVFTHFYLPERPNAVSSVFGLDLQTPPGRTHGRFVTHPLSELRLTKRDDLHEVVFVAVPPWDDDSVAAFDRRGRRYPVEVVDAVPPDESLPA